MNDKKATIKSAVSLLDELKLAFAEKEQVEREQREKEEAERRRVEEQHRLEMEQLLAEKQKAEEEKEQFLTSTISLFETLTAAFSSHDKQTKEAKQVDGKHVERSELLDSMSGLSQLLSEAFEDKDVVHKTGTDHVEAMMKHLK